MDYRIGKRPKYLLLSDLLNSTRSSLIALFILSVSIRLIYVKLAIQNLGFDRFALWAPDSRLYLLIADHIISWHEMGSYGLLRVGPGYGLILAGIKLIFGHNLIWPILFSVLMGGLAPVFVYLLAFKMFESRAISILAGLISAFSLTSIAASTHILTDQTFFTLHAAALLCFVTGYQTARTKWFVFAGLLAGIAAYVRPVGMFWPYIFIFLTIVIPLGNKYKTRFDLIKKAGITGMIILLMIWGWSARNYVLFDKFIYGTNGMITLRNCLVAQVAQKYWGEGKKIGDYRTQWANEDGDRSEYFPQAYDKAKVRVIRELKNNPRAMLGYYWTNMIKNMTAENGYVLSQISQISDFMKAWNNAIKKWLGHLLLLSTIAGLVLLFSIGLKFQFWILGATYGTFSLILGGSIWQGSRLHYPAEMAWSIILAFLFAWTFETAKNRLKSIKPV